jgi:hypothetical protein
MMPSVRSATSLALLISLVASCSEGTTELLPSAVAARVDAGRAASDAGDAAAQVPRPGATRCDDHACACDDGLDQDDDMLIDGLDPECTGPGDDDEASFGTGSGDGELAACQGCFWHGAGTASSQCSRPLDCTFGVEPEAALAESCGACTVADSCPMNCLRSTPNGCDCFGCCEARLPEGTAVHVLLTSTCSLTNVKDETKCPRCRPSPECLNPCGTCELCGNKKRRDLARECRGSMATDEPQSTCDDGQPVCDETTPCPETYYCQLGCCRIVVL